MKAPFTPPKPYRGLWRILRVANDELVGYATAWGCVLRYLPLIFMWRDGERAAWMDEPIWLAFVGGSPDLYRLEAGDP